MSILGKNGSSPTEQRKEVQEAQTKNEMHRDAHRSMFNDDGQLSTQYLEQLVNDGLDEGTAKLMKNMLTQDFILSKIDEAEKGEMKWLVRTMKEKLKADHPGRLSIPVGELRMAAYDSESEALRPLSRMQENKIDQAIWAIFFRVSRSVGGWQQKELSSQYQVSKMEDNNSQNSKTGGLFS